MNNLILQNHLGDKNYFSGFNQCLSSVQQYSLKCNTSYMFTKHSTMVGKTWPYRSWSFNLLDLIYDTYYDQYDDILWLETDIIVDPAAPNIFEIIKEKHIDLLANHQSGLFYPNSAQFAKDLGRAGSKVILSDGEIRYFCAGVLLFTKKGRLKARERWDKNWKKIQKACGIQRYDCEMFLNAMINKHDMNVLWLDRKWNHMVKTPKDSDAYFYHFQGARKDFIDNFLDEKK